MRTIEWQPIETAPRDGTLIDVWCVAPEGVEYDGPGIRLTDVSCKSEFHQWVRILDDGNEDIVEDNPVTYLGLPPWKVVCWMPIPEGPNEYL